MFGKQQIGKWGWVATPDGRKIYDEQISLIDRLDFGKVATMTLTVADLVSHNGTISHPIGKNWKFKF